jgi:hypothetical protein
MDRYLRGKSPLIEYGLLILMMLAFFEAICFMVWAVVAGDLFWLRVIVSVSLVSMVTYGIRTVFKEARTPTPLETVAPEHAPSDR